MHALSNIFWLGLKELRSFLNDYVLLGLVIYTFTLAVMSQAQSNSQELRNASIAIVDEDNSALSRQIASGFLPPYFKKPVSIRESDIDRLMNLGRFTFVLDIPPYFERDVRAGRKPAIQLLVDATAMVQAGIGSGYASQIIKDEINRFMERSEPVSKPPVNLAIRVAFNPECDHGLVHERDGHHQQRHHARHHPRRRGCRARARAWHHGSSLVMPLTPFEIAMAKVWANGLIIAVAVFLSLEFVVQGLLHVPINGSVPLFMMGVCLYLFFATAIGIFLATVARTMPQLGLLYMLVAMPMNILSGSNTPLDSQPAWLRTIMQASPSTHFVSFAQAILYRGADFQDVWPRFLAVGLIGALFLAIAVMRFRRVAEQAV